MGYNPRKRFSYKIFILNSREIKDFRIVKFAEQLTIVDIDQKFRQNFSGFLQSTNQIENQNVFFPSK